MRPSLRPVAMICAAALLALAGCGTQSPADSLGSGATDGGDSSSATPDGAPERTGESAAYDFTATTLDKESFTGASLAGTPAVLWFWAPWCPTCRAQIPAVTRLAEQYADEVPVIGVGGLDEAPAIEELARDIPDVTHLVDPQGEVWKHFGVTAQSSYTIIDAEGQIVSEGYLDDDELADLVAELAG